MEFDFNQVSELLGSMNEEELQHLQEAAQSLFGSMGGEQGWPNEPSEPFEEGGGQESASSFGFGDAFSGITPELLEKLTRLMQQMNRRDPRSDLILALKPHLSRKRQKRAEQAMQMMRMLEILPMLQETMRGRE
ncbi:MAG: hypothetical protein FWH26_08435 [Oscillospiraceae bacterium]|nr:hypothetical protein [Oscillospiraceae bacterium]